MTGRIRLFASVLAAALAAGAVSASGQQVRYYHLDAVGSVRALTNAQGTILERHDYLPFGEECTSGGCASNPGLNAGGPRKFTSKERDKETGFDYFGARYHSAKIARFTSVDPYLEPQTALLDPQQWNRYAHARNSPLKFVDPDGRHPAIVVVLMAIAFVLNNVNKTNLEVGRTADTIVPNELIVTAGAGVAAGGVRAGARAVLEEVVENATGLPVGGLPSPGKTDAGDLGSIYRVPGSGTPSGMPYIGRHNKPDPAKTRRSKDGRDRKQAEVVDTYDPADVGQGRIKEQTQIDAHGGVEKLDNKRNEIRKD